jgi:hypothetical protein
MLVIDMASPDIGCRISNRKPFFKSRASKAQQFNSEFKEALIDSFCVLADITC